MNNVGYVTEAKRRGLSCGVTEVVAKPNGQCQGSYNAATWDNCVGTHTFSNGSKYVSQFKDGVKHRQGTSTYPDGNKYVGQYKDGKRNGQGFFFFSDGRAEFCTYADDKGSNCIGTNAYDVAITSKNNS